MHERRQVVDRKLMDDQKWLMAIFVLYNAKVCSRGVDSAITAPWEALDN